MMSTDDLVFTHQPYGVQHPYAALPYERSPRDPRPGDAVELTVAVASSEPADQVWLHYSIDGQPANTPLTAIAAGDCEAGQLWKAVLPAVGTNQQVAYHFQAASGERILTSETFSFDVADWVTLKAVIAARRLGNTLYAQISTSRPGWFADLEVKLDGDQVHQHWSFGTQAAQDALVSGLEVENEHLAVRLLAEPLELEIHNSDKGLRIVELLPATLLVGADGKALELRQAFASPRDEAFFGFGERFNALNQRGNRLETRVYEQYRKQGKRTYFPVPFFLSSYGYGQYQETNRMVIYDLAAENPDRLEISVELGADQSHMIHWFCPGNPEAVIQQFTHMTGKPALPPKWVFGPWMSSNEWNSQEIVLEQLRLTKEHKIPATVLVIEAWSDECNFYIWNDAQFTPQPGDTRLRLKDFQFPAGGKWPNPKGMIDELHGNGVRLVLWQIPAYKRKFEPGQMKDEQHAIDGAYLVEKGYIARRADGTPYEIRSPWFGTGYLPDFTNPQASAWWIDKRRYLVEEMGVDGFKTDGGEHIWGRDLLFFDGRGSDELWNLYPALYQKAYYELVNQYHPGQGALFSRAGFTGAQQYPCHWAGDEFSTYEAYRASIFAGLSAGISGVPFWGWDIAGFSGEVPSAELYLRATAMAAFCPIMQYHSEYNDHKIPNRDRSPWNIQARSEDERVIPIYRFFANLRLSLLPYIWSESIQSAQSGLPLMRALSIAYPDDPQTLEYPFQYMFGSSLLVAPVVEPDRESQMIYLPEGLWYDLWSGEKYVGGRALEVPVPLETIPVFVKGGSVLPLDLGAAQRLGEAPGEAAQRVFRIYPDNQPVEAVWYSEPGQAPLRVRIEPDGTIQPSSELPGLEQVIS